MRHCLCLDLYPCPGLYPVAGWPWETCHHGQVSGPRADYDRCQAVAPLGDWHRCRSGLPLCWASPELASSTPAIAQWRKWLPAKTAGSKYSDPSLCFLLFYRSLFALVRCHKLQLLCRLAGHNKLMFLQEIDHLLISGVTFRRVLLGV